MRVLAGATDVLREARIVFLEMSLAELYKEQAGFVELFKFLEAQGVFWKGKASIVYH